MSCGAHCGLSEAVAERELLVLRSQALECDDVVVLSAIQSRHRHRSVRAYRRQAAETVARQIAQSEWSKAADIRACDGTEEYPCGAEPVQTSPPPPAATCFERYR